MNFKNQEPFDLLDCNLKEVKVLFKSDDFILQIKNFQFLSEEQVKISLAISKVQPINLCFRTTQENLSRQN